MLPSLSSLVRERQLLLEVLSATQHSYTECCTAQDTGECQPEGGINNQGPSEEAKKNIVDRVADKLEARDTLEELPRELLVDIAGQFLESPVWHLCQLGEASEHLGKIFNDEALWQGTFETRFGEAEKSPSRKKQRASSPTSSRQMYAELHLLEMRFREGRYSSRSSLGNPHKGVAVLDLRLSPGPFSTAAFAALRDGSIMVYDLDPKPGVDQECHEPQPAKPLQELTGAEGAGPALCCLPVEVPRASDNSSETSPLMLFAGFALGRLSTWDLQAGRPLVVQSWEQAHTGRISALAALGTVNSGGCTALLSASGDGLVKAWDIGADRFGDLRQTFAGHETAVVSVAASPLERSTFLTGSHDHTMRLWDARQQDGGAVASWRQQDWVTCVDFHPTSSHTIFSSDKSVHQWDLRKTGSGPVASLHRHRKLISRFRVDPLRLASCSLDGCVKVSSLEDPGVRHASPHASPMNSPTMGPSSPPALPDLHTHLAENASDVCTLRSSADYVLCIDFDATRLLAGAVDGRVDAYDFFHAGHFRQSGSPLSPLATTCRQEAREQVDMQIVGLPEIEV